MGKRGRPPSKKTLTLKSERVKAPDKKTKISSITIDSDREYYCTCCGKRYKTQVGNFSASSSVLYSGNNGFVNVCRDCVDKYFAQLVVFFNNNEEKALKKCCQVFDWYYSDEIAERTKHGLTPNTTRVRMYPSKMSLLRNHGKGKTYLETIEEIDNGKIDNIQDVETVLEEENTKTYNISKDTIEFFGFGHKPEEYDFLQQQYNDWADRCEIKSKVQEELFKNICVTQLMLQQAKQKQNIKEYTDGMKVFQDLLTSANIKPSQNSGNALVEANTLGTLIKKWEDEKPIPEPDDELKDVDNIYKYISTYFYGHLAKAMKVDNEFSELYENEIGKFTVTPQEYEDDGTFGDVNGEESEE